MFRLRNIIIAACVLIVISAAIVLVQYNNFNPKGRIGLVVQPVSAEYGLDPNHKFLGGENAWVNIKVAYPKRGSLSTVQYDVLNGPPSESGKVPKGWVHETLRVLAFKVENPRERMCQDQFTAFYERLKKAKAIMIKLENKAEKNHTEVFRIKYDGSNEVKLWPSRLVILFDEEDIKKIKK